MKLDSLLLLSTLYSVWLVTLSAAKDYYQILGVARSAKPRDIKRAFRKLAVKYHPDKYKGDKKEGEKKFLEIAKAYEILSDPEKRRKYDQFGEAAFENGGGGGGFNDFNFNFDDFFQGFDSHRTHSDRRGGNNNNGGFKFHFGGSDSDSFFNFDDLFDDGDEYNNGNGHHNANHPGGGFESFFSDFDPFGGEDSGFSFGMNDFGGFDDGFGEDFHHQGQHHVRHSGSEDGQRCKTVTKKMGNMITTHTVCS